MSGSATVDRHPTRAYDDIGLFSIEQTFRAVLGVAKRQSSTRDHVDPGFERGRHAEVVDWYADEDEVAARQIDRAVTFVVKRGQT